MPPTARVEHLCSNLNACATTYVLSSYWLSFLLSRLPMVMMTHQQCRIAVTKLELPVLLLSGVIGSLLLSIEPCFCLLPSLQLCCLLNSYTTLPHMYRSIILWIDTGDDVGRSAPMLHPAYTDMDTLVLLCNAAPVAADRCSWPGFLLVLDQRSLQLLLPHAATLSCCSCRWRVSN
jgi:hypothetical protein